MKSQSIAYLLRGNKHTHTHIYIHRILGLRSEVHSTWNLWTSGLEKLGDFFWNRAGQIDIVGWDLKTLTLLVGLHVGAGSQAPAMTTPPPMMGSCWAGWAPQKWHEL